jgi:hypothetical protein
MGGIAHVGNRGQPDPPAALHLDRMGEVLKYLTIRLMVVFFTCVTFMLLWSFWGGGVSDFPALEKRAKYELNSHGSKTEVSRFRYALESILFATGWHSMGLAMNLAAFYKSRYNQSPL